MDIAKYVNMDIFMYIYAKTNMNMKCQSTPTWYER